MQDEIVHPNIHEDPRWVSADYVGAFVQESLDHEFECNADSYLEGNPASADLEIYGAVAIDLGNGRVKVRLPNGVVWNISVTLGESEPPHYHTVISDPENGPSSCDIPERCFCDDPDADTTVWPDKCPACIRHQKEGIGSDGSRTADGSSDPNARCSHHWEVGGGPEA